MEDQHSEDAEPSDMASESAIGAQSPALVRGVVKDATKSKKRFRKRSLVVGAEGHRGEELAVELESVSCSRRLSGSGCISGPGLAEAQTSNPAMERATSYTSDEWDEREDQLSDTDGDHSDSSDDDDPRSQVDRLIDKGALMYVDDEDSALSSEGESDDNSSDYDSESDITDVSPLISTANSPIGLSPVLPRRTVPTSPLALHDNRDLCVNPFNWDVCVPKQSHEDEEDEEHNLCDNRPPAANSSKDATNMQLLLQAVIELETKNRRKKSKLNRNNAVTSRSSSSEQIYIHPIRDNPHHTHLNKTSNKRKNMSFSNEEVHKIDRENRILLRKLISAHNRHNNNSTPAGGHPRFHKPSNSSVSRRKDEEKIKRENLLLLKRIGDAKPSKDVVVNRTAPSYALPLHRNRLRSPTASCGASIRTMAQPSVQTPRKETAL